MLLMRHLTSLHLTGQLDEKSDNWFKSPRLMEELYDLENDPFELNNLSLDPNYTDIKKKLSVMYLYLCTYRMTMQFKQ